MFRRRDESATEQTPEETAKQGGKGRPTPKRSEAEKNRRQLVTAPKDRKEAYRQVRERQAQQRAKAREGMAKGDTKFLPKRDQGPVRKLARDYVDSRRTAGSYLMFVMLGTVLMSFIRVPVIQVLFVFIPPLLLFVVLIEGFFLSRKVKRLAAERFPGQDAKGVGMYAALRSLQIRRLRIPTPAVKPGDDY